jgi:3-deoxy-7-phosphoheptulonate synthase
VHHDPDRALSDGPQSIFPSQLVDLIREVTAIAPIVGRSVPAPLAAAAGVSR